MPTSDRHRTTPLPQGVPWTSPIVLVTTIPRATLLEWWGPPHQPEGDSNGTGRYEAWAIRWGCGLELVLWLFPDDGDRRGNVEVYANERDAAHILAHLDVHHPELTRVDRRVCPPTRLKARVVYEDLEGTRFEIARHSSRCAAELDAFRMELDLDTARFTVEDL